jgi:hypothetical protein
MLPKSAKVMNKLSKDRAGKMSIVTQPNLNKITVVHVFNVVSKNLIILWEKKFSVDFVMQDL